MVGFKDLLTYSTIEGVQDNSAKLLAIYVGMRAE